jgi:hypothetical protein
MTCVLHCLRLDQQKDPHSSCKIQKCQTTNRITHKSLSLFLHYREHALRACCFFSFSQCRTCDTTVPWWGNNQGTKCLHTILQSRPNFLELHIHLTLQPHYTNSYLPYYTLLLQPCPTKKHQSLHFTSPATSSNQPQPTNQPTNTTTQTTQHYIHIMLATKTCTCLPTPTTPNTPHSRLPHNCACGRTYKVGRALQTHHSYYKPATTTTCLGYQHKIFGWLLRARFNKRQLIRPRTTPASQASSQIQPPHSNYSSSSHHPSP